MELQRKQEENYRKQIEADTTSANHNQNAVNVAKPQTTVDFTKSLNLGKEEEEDKLKKLFKAR